MILTCHDAPLIVAGEQLGSNLGLLLILVTGIDKEPQNPINWRYVCWLCCRDRFGILYHLDPLGENCARVA